MCERCGVGNNDHQSSQCKTEAKCVNCDGNHMSRSSDREVWKKENETMKVKVTNRLIYPEARILYEQHKPDFTFAKVVQSMAAKPETKVASTQYNVKDSEQKVQKLLSLESQNKAHKIQHQVNHRQSSEKNISTTAKPSKHNCKKLETNKTNCLIG